MKLDLCDVCLAEKRLSKTTAKGQTVISGTRLSLCKRKSCSNTWKKINSNRTKVLNLLEKSYENLGGLVS